MIGFSILMGSLAALLWSIGDLLAKQYMDAWKGARSWVLWNQITGTFFYAVFFLLWDLNLPSLTGAQFGLITILGLVGLGGYFFFFSAIEKGNLSIVCPLSSAWAGITFILSALFLPRLMPGNAWIFLFVILAGVILISVPHSTARRSKSTTSLSIILSLGAVLCWGIFNFSVKITSASAGPFLPIVAIKVWGTAIAIAFAFQKQFAFPFWNNRTFTTRNMKALAALPIAALLDIAAYAAFVIGASSGILPIVAAFGSLFSLFAALLGVFFLKERLSRLHWIGIACIIVGSFLLMIVDKSPS